MSTITPLTPTPPLGSYGSRPDSSRPDGQGTPPLGEIFKATVLEMRSENRYLLDIAGNRLIASSQTGLSPGQQLQLQVISTSPQIELNIVSDLFTALTTKSLILFSNNLNLGALITTLSQGDPSPLSQLSSSTSSTLQSFFPETLQNIINSKEGGSFLHSLFNRLGFNLEALLAQGLKNDASMTLKASLLEIANRFQHSERISEQVGKLLSTLELFQLAQLQLDQHRFLLFPLPLPFLDQGYLLVERQEHKDSEDAGTDDEQNFSMHLSMTGLGHVKIIVTQRQEGLLIRFYLESKDKAAFAAQHEDLLRRTMPAIKIVSISFSEGAGDPATELIRRLIPKEQSILNTTV